MKKNRVFCINSLLFIPLISILTGSCNKEDNSPKVEKVIDVDGNIYTTLIIGTQIWLGEDLKVKSFRNGDPISTTNLDISNEPSPKYQWAYGNDENTLDVYGRLYTWYTATDTRKVCPLG
jgi:uncharacterized protein (TIGR02145 family)